jgi:hypothetical protein
MVAYWVIDQIHFKILVMNNTIKFLLLAFSIFVSQTFLLAQEGGMWIPSLLEGFNEEEMQDLGMELSAEDIYSINSSSLKDAIVRFGRGCTGEIISEEGLLLTNHHCGYGTIQSHSSIENNLLKDGFWAMNKSEELANPGLTAMLVNRIEDVTDQVLAGVSDEMSNKEKQSKIDQNLEMIRSKAEKEEHQEVMIRPFYYGNKYYLFVTTTFRDVRLVGAPPESIGKFGADTDNWVFPRHNADFALFRIYAGKDNLPADYSEDNVPYKPAHHLPVSMKGVKEGDFTMVFGFPGRTREYLPAVAIEQIVDVINPGRIAIRDASLKVMDQYMRADEAIRLQYASKFAGIANYWKKWIGESQGLKATGAVEEKRKIEAKFRERIAANPEWQANYGHLLSHFDSLYQLIEPYAFAEAYTYEATIRNIELMNTLGYIDRLVSLYENNGELAFTDFRSRLLPYLAGSYKDYHPEIDREVFEVLSDMYLENMEDRFIPESFKSIPDAKYLSAMVFDNTMFTNYQKMEALLMQDSIPMVIDIIKQDPGYTTALEWRKVYDELITPEYNRLQEEINALQKEYMKALMEVFPEERFFPDANSTLRITYGQVKGYHPRDAVYYEPSTHLKGVMEKYKPGDYEFDVPQKLIDLYEAKDFGPYADESGDVPVCFIGTNHTTGGNSGSPALDANGNLVGLNFDRVWEGTMSDLYYDPSICRNIMVDARYILFIIDKFAGAGHLIEEMDIVK